jgi:hypothetical protein
MTPLDFVGQHLVGLLDFAEALEVGSPSSPIGMVAKSQSAVSLPDLLLRG